MLNPLRISLLAVLAALVVSPGLAEADTPELTVAKARMDFAKKPGRHTLELRLEFDPALLSPSMAPHEGPLTVTIGPEAVISLPFAADRGTWRVKEKKGVYRYRRKRTKRHPDSLDLKVNLRRGVLKLSADRLDLSEVYGRGPEEVTFSLTLSGLTLSKTIEMGQRDRRWKYRYTGKGRVDPKGVPGMGGIGGGGSGGGGLPGSSPVSFRVLNLGGTYAPTTFRTTVLRTKQAYDAEWLKRYPPPPPGSKAPSIVQPGVDFTRDLVVIIDLGTRPTLGYHVFVTGATAAGEDLLVEWMEGQPGANCFVGQAAASPFVIAAVTRREGTVTFSGTVQKVDCQK